MLKDWCSLSFSAKVKKTSLHRTFGSNSAKKGQTGAGYDKIIICGDAVSYCDKLELNNPST